MNLNPLLVLLTLKAYFTTCRPLGDVISHNPLAHTHCIHDDHLSEVVLSVHKVEQLCADQADPRRPLPRVRKCLVHLTPIHQGLSGIWFVFVGAQNVSD